jgi:thiamine-monophosphate kinase
MSGMSEHELVALLQRSFGGAAARRAALVGIGDDAAVLAPGRGRFVWTIDTSVEGVHFRRRWLSLEDVGARSFHAAVSDIAAMGGSPVAALANLVLPKGMSRSSVRALIRGQARAARELGCPVVGGNLSRGAELGVTTTVIGRVGQPLLRSGARAGDELWLIGDVGLARAGLLWLSRRSARGRSSVDARSRRAIARCVEAWRRPRALVREGRLLGGRAHAAIDVSDGLSTDARHLADESRVRIVIEALWLEEALRPELGAAADALGVSPVELALAGGEDYALLATGSRRSRPRVAQRIGRVEKGRGVFLESGSVLRRLDQKGFDHFARKDQAAGAYLRRHGIPALSVQEADALQAEVDQEVVAWRKRRARRRVA